MKIFIPCNPPRTTAQQKGLRIAKNKSGGQYIHHYRKKKVQDARDLYAEIFQPYAPQEPFSGPLKARVTFLYPFLKSERKSVIKTGWKWKVTRPDTGNIAKEPYDVLSALGYWTDDATVCCDTVRKAFCHRTGIVLQIEPLKDVMPSDVAEILEEYAINND